MTGNSLATTDEDRLCSAPGSSGLSKRASAAVGYRVLRPVGTSPRTPGAPRESGVKTEATRQRFVPGKQVLSRHGLTGLTHSPPFDPVTQPVHPGSRGIGRNRDCCSGPTSPYGMANRTGARRLEQAAWRATNARQALRNAPHRSLAPAIATATLGGLNTTRKQGGKSCPWNYSCWFGPSS